MPPSVWGHRDLGGEVSSANSATPPLIGGAAMDAGVRTSFRAPSPSRPPELAALPYLCKTFAHILHAPKIATSPPRPTSTPAPGPLGPGTGTCLGKQILLSPALRRGPTPCLRAPPGERTRGRSRSLALLTHLARLRERPGEGAGNGSREGESWVARAWPRGNGARAHSADLSGVPRPLRLGLLFARPFSSFPGP